MNCISDKITNVLNLYSKNMYYTNNYPQELNNEFPEYCENSSPRYPSSKETEYLFQQLDEINDYSLNKKQSNNNQ